MLGAIAGDVIGSVYEGRRRAIKREDFPLFVPACRFTDDTVLTAATADALLSGGEYGAKYRQWYRTYPGRGYGGTFPTWGASDSAGPYGSFGNGSAMRVSPVGWAFDGLDLTLEAAHRSAAATHDHPEGIKGAQAVAASVYLARTGASKEDIRSCLTSKFGYSMNRTVEEIRPVYRFDVTCQGSVPEAVIAFLDSAGFEDAVRKAVSLGGDADTQAAITGAIAEAFYGGVPGEIEREVLARLDLRVRATLGAFRRKYVREGIPSKAVTPVTPAERYRGCLLGLAVGDAVGSTVEFRSPGTFSPVEDMTGGGPFDLEPGQWTDDTSMALCLAESLVETRGSDPEDQLRRYVRWYREGYLSSNGRCFDIGNATRKALQRFERTGEPYPGDCAPDAAGNGSLMRLAAVPLAFARDLAVAAEKSGESSRTTHGATVTVDACRYFGTLLAAAVTGASKEDLLAEPFEPAPGYWTDHPLAPEIMEIAMGSYKRREPPLIQGSGYVVKTLEAALWAFARADSFREGCLLVVNLGDDADTTAAVYGQLAGAVWGEAAIPAHWRGRLAHRNLIETLAERLLTLDLPLGEEPTTKVPIPAPSPTSPSLPRLPSPTDAVSSAPEVRMFDYRLMCRDVAGQLWAMYHERPDAPSLLLPMKRDTARRVSEQESKILITQWLAGHAVNYSIETPTQGAYQQSGQAGLSARIDVTAYGSSDPTDRRLNMELKAGTSSLEAYRKDFEKLLREGIPGLWFHTLTSASEGAWQSIKNSMAGSFSRLITHADAAQHTVHFAFCVLNPPQLVEFDMDFSADWRAEFERAFETGKRQALRPEWQPSFVAAPTPKQTVAPSYSGGQTKTLIYAPTLEPSSFLHLSTKGDSYALRSFTAPLGVCRWKEAGVPTTGELRAKFPIEIEIDVAAERKDLKGEVPYWIARIEELNRRHGIGFTAGGN